VKEFQAETVPHGRLCITNLCHFFSLRYLTAVKELDKAAGLLSANKLFPFPMSYEKEIP
jgi:hypothetical protein